MRHLYEEGFTDNRELSWLRYLERILEEAEDQSVPLLERFQFLAISRSSLTEFYRVRVASLRDQQVLKASRDPLSGLTSAEQLTAISRETRGILQRQERIEEKLIRTLAAEGLNIPSLRSLSPEEQDAVLRTFRSKVLPSLDLQILHPGEAFPGIQNGEPVLLARIRTESGERTGLVRFVSAAPSFLRLPEDSGTIRILLTESLLLDYAEQLFAPFELRELALIRVERSAGNYGEADWDLSKEALARMRKILAKRVHQAPVRLLLNAEVSFEMKEILMEQFALGPDQIFVSGMADSGLVLRIAECELPKDHRERLCYPPFRPSQGFSCDVRILDQVRVRDLLISCPYESLEPIIRMVRDAADDPAVTAVRISVFRLSEPSSLADALLAAAAAGKKVQVLLELRARFNEAKNAVLSERLLDAGCQVFYGSDSAGGRKVHAKFCQIVREEKGKKRLLTAIGTGNYHERTAKSYTDLHLITMDPGIGKDCQKLFRSLIRGRELPETRDLLIAPRNLRTKLTALIEREKEKGERGRIFLKVNSLQDPAIIEQLAEASMAGVRIRMIVRGICCLRPGVPACTENIEIVSVVGRFLEHSRVYLFGSGEDEVLYLSSADPMTRNLDRRVEAACPVRDPELREEIRHQLYLGFHDNVKGRRLRADGRYERKEAEAKRIDSQRILLLEKQL